jgi:cell division protease FtsH
MEEDRRKSVWNRRQKADRRGPNSDRREDGGLKDKRTSISLLYFLLAFLILIGINYLFTAEPTEELAYSELKQRIAAGQVAEVTVAEDRLEAVPTDELKEAGAPDRWVATRVHDDPDLIPLLEEQGVAFEGRASTWFGPALIWLIPLTLLILFWVWMFRRMSTAQGS